jgi:hypothetical protein
VVFLILGMSPMEANGKILVGALRVGPLIRRAANPASSPIRHRPYDRKWPYRTPGAILPWDR